LVDCIVKLLGGGECVEVPESLSVEAENHHSKQNTHHGLPP
jgi:hypothetical protein